MEELTLLLDTYRPEVLEAHRVIRCGPYRPTLSRYTVISPPYRSILPHAIMIYHDITLYCPDMLRYRPLSPHAVTIYPDIGPILPHIAPYCHDIA